MSKQKKSHVPHPCLPEKNLFYVHRNSLPEKKSNREEAQGSTCSIILQKICSIICQNRIKSIYPILTCRGQMDTQPHTLFTHYSGISSHSQGSSYNAPGANDTCDWILIAARITKRHECNSYQMQMCLSVSGLDRK